MIILTCGQPKSASTHLSLLIKHACNALGGDQELLRKRAFSDGVPGSNGFWGVGLGPLAQFANDNSGEYLAIKTHSPYVEKLESALQEQKIIPFISYRNIGDAALSAYEAGERARNSKNNTQTFDRLETHRQAIDRIGKHLNNATIPWLKTGYGLAFSFEEITQTPEVVLRKVGGMIGADPDVLLRDKEVQNVMSGKTRAYNFNKGVSGRHREIFSSDDLSYLEEHYGNFNRFCAGEIDIENL